MRAYHVLSNGEQEFIGEVSNANIFSEITERTFQMAINKADLGGGSIRIVLSHYDKENAFIYDEKTFPLE